MVYCVTVGNLGTVYIGGNGTEAKRTYEEYVAISKKGEGRVGGEPVLLMQGNQIIKEFQAKGH